MKRRGLLSMITTLFGVSVLPKRLHQDKEEFGSTKELRCSEDHSYRPGKNIKYCIVDGLRLTLVNPPKCECGRILHYHWDFCAECGRKVTRARQYR